MILRLHLQFLVKMIIISSATLLLQVVAIIFCSIQPTLFITYCICFYCNNDFFRMFAKGESKKEKQDGMLKV